MNPGLVQRDGFAGSRRSIGFEPGIPGRDRRRISNGSGGRTTGPGCQPPPVRQLHSKGIEGVRLAGGSRKPSAGPASGTGRAAIPEIQGPAVKRHHASHRRSLNRGNSERGRCPGGLESHGRDGPAPAQVMTPGKEAGRRGTEEIRGPRHVRHVRRWRQGTAITIDSRQGQAADPVFSAAHSPFAPVHPSAR